MVKQTPLTAAQQQSLAERERLEALGLAKPKRTYSQLISEALLSAQDRWGGVQGGARGTKKVAKRNKVENPFNAFIKSILVSKID